MKIALIGYGSMSQLIQKIAQEKGHTISQIVDPKSPNATAKSIHEADFSNTDVAIDFSLPEVVMENIAVVTKSATNMVVGTTGWYEKMSEVEALAKENNTGLLWSSNFSIGVNLYFKMVEYAAKLIDNFPEYDIWAHEIHHNGKVDSPSGTAKTLEEILISNIERKSKVVEEKLERQIKPEELHFSSTRGGPVNFKHTIAFDSKADTIEMIHSARNRDGYAQGAVIAAEWIFGKKDSLVWTTYLITQTKMSRAYAGTWTALITPFKSDGSIDEQALRKLVNMQIEGGVTGLLPMGTTGESPATTMEEDTEIFKIVVDEAKGRAKIMAGTGSNVTRDAIKYTNNAKEAGADCALVVSPYYNKPTQEGLKLHFEKIAKETEFPIIVYNIKGRTGVNIETETLMEIAKNPYIVGVKEASGDMNQMKEVLSKRDDNFTVLSGDDSLTLELIENGGDGVVSVSSNIMPKEVTSLVNMALEGKLDEAREINKQLSSMFEKLFIETNPLPVKYAAHRMGLCELVYRLPMCPPSQETQKIIDALLTSYNLA